MALVVSVSVLWFFEFTFLAVGTTIDPFISEPEMEIDLELEEVSDSELVNETLEEGSDSEITIGIEVGLDFDNETSQEETEVEKPILEIGIRNLSCYEVFCIGPQQVEKCLPLLKHEKLTDIPLLPCMKVEDALNHNETIKRISEEPDVRFKMGCVNIRTTRNEELDSIIQWCYAKPYKAKWDDRVNDHVLQTSFEPIKCDLPYQEFWKNMRQGKLKNGLGKELKTLRTKIKACFCDYKYSCIGDFNSHNSNPEHLALTTSFSSKSVILCPTIIVLVTTLANILAIFY